MAFIAPAAVFSSQVSAAESSRLTQNVCSLHRPAGVRAFCADVASGSSAPRRMKAQFIGFQASELFCGGRTAAGDAFLERFLIELQTNNQHGVSYIPLDISATIEAAPPGTTGTLAKKLKEGTAKSHSMAENVGFVKGFLNGLVEKESYRKLVANLYFVYSAMEEEMARNKDHPLVKPIYYSELDRKEALEADLHYYYGDAWKEQAQCSPAAKEYVARLHDVGRRDPGLLVAHAYTRYLGDLSGGQILKKIAQKAMGLGDDGVNFYNFKDIKDERAFKNMYRTALNDLPVDDKYAEAIVEEANDAFRLNMNMFTELEGNYVKTLFQMFMNTVFPKEQKKGRRLAGSK